MKLVLLGAPGAGKGTQAEKIAEKYNVVHISTGDIFRFNIKNNTELGKLAKTYIDAGKLVPDSVTCEIVKDRLQQDDVKGGYMLDGFPRNEYQANDLAKYDDIDVCLNLAVDESLLLERICGRRMCACGASYHVSTLGGRTTCLRCGKELYVREDDNPETVKSRLDTYYKNTAPLIDYYKSANKLKTVVCGEKSPDEVFESVKEILDEYV